jgi:hypothetical protein
MSSAIRCLFLFCIVTTLNAQSPQQEPRFALEVQSGNETQPSYSLVPRGQDGRQTSFFFTQVLVPLPPETAAVDDQKKPCALGFESKEDGDAVSIVASVYFASCNPRDFGRFVQNGAGQLLGNYSARLDETLVLEEMRQFGFQPYTIKVVSAQVPHTVVQTLSKVPSLQIAIVGEDRQTYKLVVRNTSPRAVTGIVIARSYQNGRQSVEGYDDLRSMIAPGADHEFKMNSNNVNCASTDSSMPGPVSCPIVLEGAIFADGTYGGDAGPLANVEARYLAERTQRQRLRKLLQNTLGDSSLSDAAKIEQVRSGVSQLEENLDPAIIDQIQSRYPDLPNASRLDMEASMRASFQMEKRIMLESLGEFEESSQESSIAESMAKWLNQKGMTN